MPYPIKHLVVLMLENRSFDHMLGYLPGVNGIPKDWTNPLQLEGPLVPATPNARTVHDLIPDPGHEWVNVNVQIFENSAATGPATMQGFVLDYHTVSQDIIQAPNIMKCFTPETLPVLHTLASQYAVCDRWFSSVPGSTIPNRLFSHAANSYGSLTQDAVAAPFPIRTIFEEMDVPPNPANYAIYTHGSSILMANEYLQTKKQDHFFDFAQHFANDSVNGDLPEYTFIEPAYDDDVNNGTYANSQHPDFPVDEGESLIAQVYNALCASPDWNDTLLLITYDEHGGIQDHVPPPNVSCDPANAGLPGVPPSTSPPFAFDRLGVRVPTVFVSPRIAPNTLIRDHEFYEHCSIVATVRKLFCGTGAEKPFNWREAQAPTFENLLVLDKPRPDVKLPDAVSSAGVTPAEIAAANQMVASVHALSLQAAAEQTVIPPAALPKQPAASRSPTDLMMLMAQSMNYSLQQRGIKPPTDINTIYTAQDVANFIRQANAAAGRTGLMQLSCCKSPPIVLALAVLFLLPLSTHAQSAEYSCPHFFHLHQAVDCVEALFSEDAAPLLYTHFTVGSVPPGNGFALGLITEKPTHFVSAFTPVTPPDMRDSEIFVVPSAIADPEAPKASGRKSYFVPRIGEAVSTNGSWYVTGGFDWMPGLYLPGHTNVPPLRPGLPKSTYPCHRLGKLCTDSVLTLHFNAGHSVARTIDYYGLGEPASPPTQYTFRVDQTYGGLQARMPLFDFHTTSTSNEFSLDGAVEFRGVNLPVESLPASVYENFNAFTLPGLGAQPTYLHSSGGALDVLTHISEQKLKPGQTPRLKRYDAVTLQSSFHYHAYLDTGSSAATFQQAVADANVAIEIGAINQKYLLSQKDTPFLKDLYYQFLAHHCGGLPARPRVDLDPGANAAARKAAEDEAGAYLKRNGYRYEVKPNSHCDFGTLTFSSHLAASHASRGNTIPFFVRPTVGGQDIDSLSSLRGFANYRFRGNDATFLQASYTLPVYDPLGVLVFYDAGNAGDTLGALSFAHLRQDAGFGVNIRIMRVSYAQAYVAWGAGSGPYLGYNLVKQF